MKKALKSMMCMMLALSFVLSSLQVFGANTQAVTEADAGDFFIEPKTEYARKFTELAEGQTWFLQEIERLLNAQQKTVALIESAEELYGIRAIGLQGKGISGMLPAALGELKGLEYLFLADNVLEGEIPPELTSLPHLRNIDLGNNRLSGGIPEGFGAMAQLRVLILAHNGFSGAIPADIAASTTLETLDLQDNKLTGGIPADIGKMTSLLYLNLSKNPLGGGIPEISALTKLKTLALWECELVGDIHESVFSLSALEVLDLAHNRLGGELPQLSGVPKLKYIALNDNCLRGLVSEEWKQRENAGTLIWLDNNYLTGEILKRMKHYENNFADGAATPQYQLTAKEEYAIVSMIEGTNIIEHLQKTLVGAGEAAAVTLLPTDFEFTYDESKLIVTANEKGLFVQARQRIPKSKLLPLEIRIRGNNGSEYSKVVLMLTTDNGVIVVETARYHTPYIDGEPGGVFRPDEAADREQVTKMLVAALEKKPSSSQKQRYSDVPVERWSFPWIEAASEAGYLNGYPDGSFGPERAITRAEMAAVLVRIADSEGLGVKGEPGEFADVKPEAWHAGYVRDASAYGLIRGYGDGTFRPNQPVTRAEAVAMINRLIGRTCQNGKEHKGNETPFTDMSPSHWAYPDILEASVKHTY